MSRKARRAAPKTKAKIAAVPEPAGSAFFAVDMPADTKLTESHTDRIVRLLAQWGYNATVLTGEQVMEAGAHIARTVAAQQQIQNTTQETDA